jgi:hypothetical protein
MSTSDPSNPVSPLSRTSTFPHKTSPAVSSQTPLIDTNTPAINAAPVELDGSSVGTNVGRAGGGVLSPADEEDIDAEFLGGGAEAGRGVREVRLLRAYIHAPWHMWLGCGCRAVV